VTGASSGASGCGGEPGRVTAPQGRAGVPTGGDRAEAAHTLAALPQRIALHQLAVLPHFCGKRPPTVDGPAVLPTALLSQLATGCRRANSRRTQQVATGATDRQGIMHVLSTRAVAHSRGIHPTMACTCWLCVL